MNVLDTLKIQPVLYIFIKITFWQFTRFTSRVTTLNRAIASDPLEMRGQ